MPPKAATEGFYWLRQKKPSLGLNGPSHDPALREIVLDRKIVPASDTAFSYRRLVSTFRLRNNRIGKPATQRPAKTLVAILADGPLSGTRQEVIAVEGRPPKTIDVDHGDRRLRYCLATWEQSGHSAVYGFLYEV